MNRIFDDNLENTYVEGCLTCLQKQIDAKGVKFLDTITITQNQTFDIDLTEYLQDFDVFVSIRPLTKFARKFQKIDDTNASRLSAMFIDFDTQPIELIGVLAKTKWTDGVLTIENKGVFDASFSEYADTIYVDIMLISKVYEQTT